MKLVLLNAIGATIALGQQVFGPVASQPLLGHYEKTTTQFSGKTRVDSSISYLALQERVSAHFPLSASGKLNQPSDLTVQFFFQKEETEAEGRQQFFRLGDDVNCFFNRDTQILCDTPERRSLAVDYERDSAHRWLHLTLGVCETGEAYLQIRDGNRVIGEDRNERFIYRPTIAPDYELCFGLCVQGYKAHEQGFIGNLREVFAKNAFTPADDVTSEHTHLMKQYDFNVLGYYRLKDEHNEFNNRQVYMRQAKPEYIQDGEMVESEDILIVPDFFERHLPVDVCPQTFLTRHLPQLSNSEGPNLNLTISKKQLSNTFDRRNWAYTFSSTFMLSRDNCHETRASEAEKSCHIFLLEGAFMLYMQQPNGARFHFFAERDYYQTQTPPFFLPYNQWITVQASLSQYGGYQIVVLNADGDILLDFQREYNMQQQEPSGSVSLFQGFSGFVSRLKLNQKQVELPSRMNQIEDALLDLNFQDVQQRKIPNEGSQGPLSFNQMLELVSVPYLVYEYKQPRANWDDEREHFDGITCDNHHLTYQVQTDLPAHTFNINYVNATEKGEQTLQFWFKFGDTSMYRPKTNQFLETEMFKLTRSIGGYEYWSVYIRDYSLMENNVVKDVRELVVAPFGRQQSASGEIQLTFRELTLENADETGWWHLSCSLATRKHVTCFLHNSKNEFTKKLDLSDYQIILNVPQGLYTAHLFNEIDKMFVKDFRFYTRALEHLEVSLTRYQQAPYKGLGLQTDFAESTQNLVPEFRTSKVFKYKSEQEGLQKVVERYYHAVCPQMTYWFDGRCYNEPVNKVSISIFPWLDSATKQMMWRLTIEQSQFVSRQVSDYVGVRFTSNDLALNYHLDQAFEAQRKLQQMPHFYDIPSTWLRQENQYEIEALISDGYFERHASVTFVPQKCHWFVVEDWDSRSARLVRTEQPGTQDIRFSLQLQKNPLANCTSTFNYYNKFDFDNFEFSFVVASERQEFMMDQPHIRQDPIYGGNTDDSLEGIIITIPAAEQYKLPVWTDIKIIMKIAWVSSKFEIEAEDLVFQNAMMTLKLEPERFNLKTIIKANTQQVSRGQTLILTANQTSISGVEPEFVQAFLQYKWYCPTVFFSFCQEQQGAPTIYIPYDQIDTTYLANISMYDFSFEVEALLRSPSQPDKTLASRADTGVKWFSGNEMPQFKIQCNPIDINSDQQSFCKIVGDGFDGDWAISSYEVEWTTAPRINNHQTYRNGQFFTFIPNELDENTTYVFVAEMQLKNDHQVNDSIKFDFFTGQKNKRKLQETSNINTLEELASFLTDKVEEPHELMLQSELQFYTDTLWMSYADSADTHHFLNCVSALVSLSKEAKLNMQVFTSLFDHALEVDPGRSVLIAQYMMQLPFNQDFRGDNFALVSQKFNFEKARMNEHHVLEALNAQVEMNAAELYWQLPFQPMQDFWYQMRAVKNPSSLNSLPTVYLRIVDSLSGQAHSIGDFDGSAGVSFKLVETQGYKPNQTICHVQQANNVWASDMCLTELDIDRRLLNCTCNLMESMDIVGILDDPSKQASSEEIIFGQITEDIDLPVDFEVIQREGVTINELSELESDTAVSPAAQGTSYFFICVVLSFSLTQLIGALYLRNLDKSDARRLGTETKLGWQQKILQQCSEHMRQPLALVKLRERHLYEYQVTTHGPTMYIAQALHPLLSPFAWHAAGESRTLRFMAYWTLVNMWIMSCIEFYADVEGNQIDGRISVRELLDQEFMCTMGALFLMPLLSNVVVDALKDSVDKKNGSVKQRCATGKTVFYVYSVSTNIIMVAFMLHACATTAYTNQFMMTLSILGSFLFATCFTNVLYIVWNAKVPFCKSQKASEILRDLAFIKGMLTIYGGRKPEVVELQSAFTTEQPIALDTQTEAAETDRRTDRELVVEERPGNIELKPKQVRFEAASVDDDSLQIEEAREAEEVVDQTVKVQHDQNVYRDDE